MQTLNAAQMWRTTFDFWRLSAEAQFVMSMRLAGMAGIWALAPGETTRMIVEKQEAFQRSAADAAAAAFGGHGAEHIAAAALRPLSRKTSANARRLRRSWTRQTLG